MIIKDEAVSLGVTEALDFWLSQRELPFPVSLEDAMAKTFRDCLDENFAIIFERLAQSK